MKTPDKIFISVERTYGASDGQVIAMVAPHNERQSVNDVEYIRKDALLEWVKEQKKDCERIIREHPEDESLWCERDKYDELIDKLNSM